MNWVPPRGRGIAPEVMAAVVAAGREVSAMNEDRRRRAEELWAGIEEGVRVIVSVEKSREVMGLWMVNEGGTPKQLEGIVYEVRVDVPGYVKVLVDGVLWRMRRDDVEVKDEELIIEKEPRRVWWVDGEISG